MRGSLAATTTINLFQLSYSALAVLYVVRYLHIGPATDLIAEGVLAVHQGMSAAELTHAVHAHPTLPEALAEAALDVDGRAVHISPRRKRAG